MSENGIETRSSVPCSVAISLPLASSITERCGSGGTTSCVGRLLKKSALAFAPTPMPPISGQRKHGHQQAGDRRQHEDREEFGRPVMADVLRHTRQAARPDFSLSRRSEGCAHGLRGLFREVGGRRHGGRQTGFGRAARQLSAPVPGLHRSRLQTPRIVSRKAIDGSFRAARGRTHTHISGSHASTRAQLTPGTFSLHMAHKD